MSNHFGPRFGARIRVVVALAAASVAGTCLAGQPFFTTNRTLTTGEVLAGAVPPPFAPEQSTADFAGGGTAAANAYVATGSDSQHAIGVRFSSDGSIVRLVAPPSTPFLQEAYVESANGGGDSVGYYQYSAAVDGNRFYVPVRWDRQGNATPLGVLQPQSSFGIFQSAYDISNSGIATGFSRSGVLSYAVRWDAGSTTPTALPGVYANAGHPLSSFGFAVNDAGTVVGTSTTSDDAGVSVAALATRWAAGGTAGLSLDPVYTGTSTESFSYRATDINDSGTTIGDTRTAASGSYTGVRWAADSSAAMLLQGFGTDTNDRSISQPKDINNAGTAVGTARIFNPSHVDIGGTAVRWDAGSGTAIALSHLPGGTTSTASAINDAGIIVGSDFAPQPVGSRAVAWMPDGRIIDLNNLLDPGSGYVLFNAWSISEDNWISGQATYDPDGPGGVGGIPHNFLIQLPEPASLASFGMLAVLLRRRAR